MNQKDNTFLMGAIPFFGRACICILFLWACTAKLMNWEGTIQYMQSKQMPVIWFFLPAAVTLQMLGSISILLGYRTRIGAALLILFIIPAASIFHDYWNLQGNERLIEQIMFMKDVGMLGGLLIILAFGPGSWSLDHCSAQAKS